MRWLTGKLPAISNDDILLGAVAFPSRHGLDVLDDAHALQDFSENNVLAIEMRGGHRSDEELRSLKKIKKCYATKPDYKIIF